MAAPCGDFEYSVEIHFAQRLASNEKKIRDKAVKRLRQWIAAKSKKETDFCEAELMKLWKGLYYCMWMSDKPVIQEDLADEIADIIHCFQQPSQAIAFFDTFVLTMKREWMGIDHLRMDKYLMFIRRCFRQMLVLLHNYDWDEELLELFLNALRRTVLNPGQDACPDGLRYHIVNVYLDELAREGTEELSPQQASSFLVPFCELAANTQNKKLRDVILGDIFQDVVERSHVGEEEDEGIASDEDRKRKPKLDGAAKKQKRGRKGDQGDEGDEGEEDLPEDDADILEKVMFPEEMVPPLEYDYSAIADKLFELASQKSVTNRNRKPIYKMVKRFQSLVEGVYPMPDVLEQIRNDRDTDYLNEELPWWKMLQAKGKKKRRKRRRKRKGQQNSIDDDEEEEEDGGRINGVKRKKVKKMKKSDDGVMLAESKEKDEEDVLAKDRKIKTKSSQRKQQTKDANGDESNTSELDGQECLEEKGSIGKTKKSKKVKNADVTSDGGAVPGDLAAKRSISKKENLAKDSDAAQNDIHTSDQADISKTLFPGSDGSSISCSDGDFLLREQTSRTIKMKKAKKGKINDVANNLGGGPQMLGVTEQKLDDDGVAKLNLQVSGKKSMDVGDLGQVDDPSTPVPFASFQQVTTPPAALVKKSISMAMGEPSTLPRAKPKARVQMKYTPPMTRKRVQIALSKNQIQAAHDYKQRIKLSPGVPFDGTKKPTHSVLKQTPERSEEATPSSKGKKKRTTRRSQAADYF